MQKLLFTLCLIFFLINTNAQRNIDILHYKFALTLNDRNDTVYGQASIELKSLQPLSSFSIDLVSVNRQGKGMRVDSVISSGLAIKNYTNNNDHLNIILSNELKTNGVINFTIHYHGNPADGLIISKNKYGERTFFADNWPNRAHNWIPCVDDPADKASFEFIITAPSHYEVVSNGIVTEESGLSNNKKVTHWKEDIPLPTKVMAIGVADFAVKQFADSPDNIPISAWIFRSDSTNGFIDYAPASAILKFLSNYIGPYPYKKLANVQSKTIFGGMENAGAIFYSENSVTGESEDESLLAHEITHQWFGDMVTEKNFAHLWLSEGFASYFTHIYIESKYGADSLEKEMQKDRNDVIEFATISDRPVVDSVSPYMRLLNINSYQKGSWILHMLRRQSGDSVFHQIIRSYYDTYKGKNADTEDFKNIAEKISGKKLDIFFHQWLYTSGQPQLEINWKYNAKGKNLILTIEQTQKNMVFQFPFEIGIVTSQLKSHIEKLSVSKKKETFIFPMKERPQKIIADPHTSLLYRGMISELK